MFRKLKSRNFDGLIYLVTCALAIMACLYLISMPTHALAQPYATHKLTQEERDVLRQKHIERKQARMAGQAGQANQTDQAQPRDTKPQNAQLPSEKLSREERRKLREELRSQRGANPALPLK